MYFSVQVQQLARKRIAYRTALRVLTEFCHDANEVHQNQGHILTCTGFMLATRKQHAG